mmetsp:Transcript_7793/g.22929  ORF Transcript_7793/g.22929 Transcript_7793/m.22929 type:complete len:696 (-) Transcript_7793:523-2610(-)
MAVSQWGGKVRSTPSIMPIDTHSRRRAEDPSSTRWRRGSSSSFRRASNQRGPRGGGGDRGKGEKDPPPFSDEGHVVRRGTNWAHEADAASGSWESPKLDRKPFVLLKLLAGGGSTTFSSRSKVGAHNCPAASVRESEVSKRYGLADPFGEEEYDSGYDSGGSGRVVVRSGGDPGGAEPLAPPAAEVENSDFPFAFGGKGGVGGAGARKKKTGKTSGAMSEAARYALLAASGCEVESEAAAAGATERCRGPVPTDPCTSPASARSYPCGSSVTCSIASDRGDDTHPSTPFALSPPSTPRSGSFSVTIPRGVKEGSGRGRGDSGGSGGPLVPDLVDNSDDCDDDCDGFPRSISLPTSAASSFDNGNERGRRKGSCQISISGKSKSDGGPDDLKLAEFLRAETENIRRLQRRNCAPDRHPQCPSVEEEDPTLSWRASSHLRFASAFSRRMREGASTTECPEDRGDGGDSDARGSGNDSVRAAAGGDDGRRSAAAPSPSNAKPRDGAPNARTAAAAVTAVSPPDDPGRCRAERRRVCRQKPKKPRRSLRRRASTSSSVTEYGTEKRRVGGAAAVTAFDAALVVACIVALVIRGGGQSARPPGLATRGTYQNHNLPPSVPDRVTSGGADAVASPAADHPPGSDDEALDLKSGTERGSHPTTMGVLYAAGVPPHEEFLARGGDSSWGSVPFLGMGIGDGYN